MRESTLWTPKSVKEEVVQALEQPVEKTIVMQVGHADCGEHHSTAGIHTASRGGPHGQPVDQAPDRSCSPWRRARAGAGFLLGAVAHQGPTLEHSVPEGLYCMEVTHAEAVHERLYPVGGMMSMTRKEQQSRSVMN